MLGSLTALRAIGLAVAVALVAASLILYRRGRLTKGHLLSSLVLWLALAAVSVRPSSIDAVRDFLLPGLEASRILSVLIVGVLAQFWILLRLTSRVDAQNRRFARLVEEMTIADYLERCPEKQASGTVLVIVPAYNEAETIASVLSEIPRAISERPVEVLAVVDGATDETRDVVEAGGYLPAINLVNQGAGAAQRVGYRIAARRGADVAVTCDADGQHQPSEIPLLVEPILRGEADIVVGSRVLGDNEDRSFVRDTGRRLYSGLISLFVGQRVTDCSSSFRAVRMSFFPRLELRQDRFPAAEFVMEAVRKGARYVEIPVEMKRRRHGESKMPPSKLKFGWSVFRVIVGTWWR
jgi:hypothetical protein